MTTASDIHQVRSRAPAHRWGRLLLAVFLLGAGSAVPAVGEGAFTPPPCEPGGDRKVDPVELRAPGEDDPRLVLRDAVITGSVTTRTLCGEGEDPGRGPCLLRGEEPTILAGLIVEGDLDLAGAVLEGGLDLTCTEVRGSLDLTDALVLGPLALNGARVTGGIITMDGILVVGPWGGRGMSVDGAVSVQGARLLEPVDLAGASLHGVLELHRSVVAALQLDEATLRYGMRAQGAAFLRGLDLSLSRIARELTLIDVRVADNMDLFDTEVGGPVLLDQALVEGDLDLTGRFEGELALRGLRLTGDADLAGAVLRGGLTLEDVRIGGMLDLAGARVHGPLQVKDSLFLDEVDLSEARFNRTVGFLRCRMEGGLLAEETVFSLSPEFVDCEPPGVGLELGEVGGESSTDSD
jgi:hypothetical protein